MRKKKIRKKKYVRVCTVDKGRRGEGGAQFLLRLRNKVSIRPPHAGRKVDEEWVNTTVITIFLLIKFEPEPLDFATSWNQDQIPRACCTAASTLVIRDIFQRTRFVVWQRFLFREYL